MIHTELDGRVATVTIDRPDRRNALDTEHCASLRTAVTEAVDAGARCVVLTGAGGHFCAGADLGGVHADGFRAALRAVLDTLVAVPAVVVAAVDGYALGAGTQLAVAADLRVATPAARFGIPAARLGLAVDRWTVARLVEVAGGGPARAMLLAAERIDGEAAHRIGLVQRLDDLAGATAWAAEIAGLAPLTVAAHKLALARPSSDAEVLAAATAAWTSADAEEGAAAFRERRPADFRGC